MIETMPISKIKPVIKLIIEFIQLINYFMIRKDFLLKFKNEESAKLEVDKNSLEDDNHLLIANRLIENKDIIRMPDSKLEKFVDKILFDTKSSKLLFSSNYKKEIEMLKRSNSILKMNQSKNDKKAISKANNTIQKKREKNEIISQAKYDIDIVMKKKYDENFQKEKINEKFFQDIVGERKRVINSEEKYKRDRLRKIYANIKNKLNNVVLPNVKLDYDDVFSRLYHNAVLTQPMLNQKLNKQSSMKNLISRRESVSTLRRNFSVKNVIESNIGKEFSMKITQAQVMKCFSKNSGGPSHKYIEKVIKVVYCRVPKDVIMIKRLIIKI